jgi:hypothetical protein
VPAAIRDIKRFLSVWKGLSPLAQRVLAEDGESPNFYEGTSVEYRILFRAQDAIRTLTTPQGRPQAIGNLRAAEVLAQIWKSHGREATPGRLYTDKKRVETYKPNAFVKFVATALRGLDPKLRSDDEAARLAKTAVDSINRSGQL